MVELHGEGLCLQPGQQDYFNKRDAGSAILEKIALANFSKCQGPVGVSLQSLFLDSHFKPLLICCLLRNYLRQFCSVYLTLYSQHTSLECGPAKIINHDGKINICYECCKTNLISPSTVS